MTYTERPISGHITWSRDAERLICRCGGSSEPLVGNEAIVSYEMHEFISLHEDCGAVAA